MTRRISNFEAPDRFITGTVGEPGHRAFFLQARQGGTIVSVAAEKTQVAVLAANLDALLDTLAERGVEGIPPGPGDRPIDDEPLGEPLVEAFRVGAMTIGWDSSRGSVIVQAAAIADEDGDDDDDDEAVGVVSLDDDDDEDGPDLLRVRLSPAEVRAFVARAARVIAGGRPLCPRCGEPLDPQGHICVRPTAYLN
jgi:uncharacterized repeat protein (TIGR03847 family)